MEHAYRITVEVIGPEAEGPQTEERIVCECDGYLIAAVDREECSATLMMNRMKGLDLARLVASTDVLKKAASLARTADEWGLEVDELAALLTGKDDDDDGL